jgi:hypothetical protein
VSERKKGGGGTTALQGSHQIKKGKNRKRERGGREKERRAVQEPPHSREDIKSRKARRARRARRAVEQPPHSREVIRPRKARRARRARRGGRAAEQPHAAFACPLKRLSTSYFTGIALTPLGFVRGSEILAISCDALFGWSFVR